MSVITSLFFSKTKRQQYCKSNITRCIVSLACNTIYLMFLGYSHSLQLRKMETYFPYHVPTQSAMCTYLVTSKLYGYLILRKRRRTYKRFKFNFQIERDIQLVKSFSINMKDWKIYKYSKIVKQNYLITNMANTLLQLI